LRRLPRLLRQVASNEVLEGLRVRLDVRRSAPDTQRQIAIAEGAQCLGALGVDGDVCALEAGCAVGRLEPLATARGRRACSARRPGSS